jgi:UDP-glucose 4-epimerase
MVNILILGGNGFIGKNIIENCLHEDFRIILLNRTQDFLDVQFIADYNVQIVEGELNDLETILHTINKYQVNVVIHLVSTLIPGSTVDDFQDELINVVFPSFRLLDHLSKTNIKFIFFSSGGTVYGKSDFKLREDHKLEPINYYGFSKLIIEDYIKFLSRINQLKYVILRPSNVYGKHQSFNSMQGFIAVAIGKIKCGKPVEIWGDGKIIRDYIYVQDVAQIILKIINSDLSNTILNIGSGSGTSLLEIIDLLQKYFDDKIELIFKERRQVDLEKMVLDIEKLKSQIDFIPTNIENGILKFIESLSNNENEKS